MDYWGIGAAAGIHSPIPLYTPGASGSGRSGLAASVGHGRLKLLWPRLKGASMAGGSEE